jgi:excisionase family DNA binding protein
VSLRHRRRWARSRVHLGRLQAAYAGATLTTKEAAVLAGVDVSRVKQWAWAGDLACVKVEGQWRFVRDDVSRCAAVMRSRRGGARKGAADPEAFGWMRGLCFGKSSSAAGGRGAAWPTCRPTTRRFTTPATPGC